MVNPVYDLYVDYDSPEEQLYRLQQMRREAEIRRARAMAQALLSRKTVLKNKYKRKIDEAAKETKDSLTAIKNQVEKGIKGKCQEVIEKVVDDYLKLYDEII